MSLSNSLPYPDLLQQMIGRSLSGFFVFNVQTERFEYLNEAFFDLWPLDADRLEEQYLALLASVVEQDRDLVHLGYRKLINGTFRQTIEFRTRFNNGPLRWVNVQAYAIIQNGKRVAIAGFAEDITDYKASETTANVYSAHKNAMLEMLAHDLGGPLGLVQAMAERLENESQQEGKPLLAEQATRIAQTASQSIDLIHNLLEQEYQESAQTPLKFGRFDLVEQLEAQLAGFKRLDLEGQKLLSLQCSHPQILVEMDLTKFLQVMANLISNAIKFTHPGGHITLDVREHLGWLRIAVSDDGIGIPEALQPMLFERFTSARRPGLKGEKTVGLGLSIVKRIVELHQGKVRVESKENQGTTFFIDMPTQQ